MFLSRTAASAPLGVLEKVNSSPTQICLPKARCVTWLLLLSGISREALLRNYFLNKVLTHFLAQAEHTLNTC